MNQKNIIIITVLSFVAGLLFFAIYNERIVIQYSRDCVTAEQLAQQHAATKKQVYLIFWHTNQWKSETQEIIWTDSKAQNVTHLITGWLHVLKEENITDKKINLQAAMLAPSDYDAFLSFDDNPLPKNGPMIDKLRLIEGLLKTIRENNIPLQTVQFLVDHQPLKDPHLNFSNPWPITGFLEA